MKTAVSLYKYISPSGLVTLILVIFFLALSLSQSVQTATYEPLIASVTIQKHRIDVTITPALREYIHCDFFAEYPPDIDLTKLDRSIALAPFVYSVMPTVWASGKQFSIESLDVDMAQALVKIRTSLAYMYPSLTWSGSLHPQTLIDNKLQFSSADKTALLFSGGVDAVHSSLAHSHEKQLLIMVWGTDVALHDKRMWRGAYNCATQFADTYGHEVTWVKSNFVLLYTAKASKLTAEIPRWWKFTTQATGYCGLAMPIAVSRGCSRMLFASTYPPDYPYPYGSHPLIDNHIACAGTQVSHDGYECNRQEKIAAIVKKSQELGAKPFLRPCWKQHEKGRNCEQCLGKCLQTMTALLIEGQDPREYGFTIPPEQIIKRTTWFFQEGSYRMSQGGTSRWQDMQRKIRKNLTQSFSYIPEVKEYLNWLAKLDMNAFNGYKEVPFKKLAYYRPELSDRPSSSAPQ